MRDNGGDLGRNLGRAVRDNPLPALLTGVGLAWLMAGTGRPADRWEDDRRSFRDYDGRSRSGRRRLRTTSTTARACASTYGAGAG